LVRTNATTFGAGAFNVTDNSTSTTASFQPTGVLSVPEPTTMLLLGAGFSLTAPSAPNVKIWALDKAHYIFRGSKTTSCAIILKGNKPSVCRCQGLGCASASVLLASRALPWCLQETNERRIEQSDSPCRWLAHKGRQSLQLTQFVRAHQIR
jgi:hypothetical protein